MHLKRCYIQPLEDHIQFCNTLLTFRQQLALFGKTFIAFLYIHIHDHLNETVFMASGEGHDLPQILKDQFLQDNRSDGVWCATHLLSFAISRADVTQCLMEAGQRPRCGIKFLAKHQKIYRL